MSKKDFHQLTPTTVDGRPGYQDARRRVVAVPKSSKRVKSWEAKMRKKGYKFPGDRDE